MNLFFPAARCPGDGPLPRQPVREVGLCGAGGRTLRRLFGLGVSWVLAVLMGLALTGAWATTAPGSATASVPRPAEPPTALDVAALQVPAYWLRPHARVLREPPDGPPWNAATLLQRADLDWQAATDSDPVLTFGTDRAAWWVHVPLAHRGEAPVTLLLEAGEPLIDYLDVWLIERGSGRVLAELHTGDRRPFGTRPLDHRHPLLPLTLAPGQQADLLLRVWAIDGEHDPLPLRLWEPAAFEAHARHEALLYGAYYGALAVLLLYNALLALGTRERAFGWYTVFLGSFLLWNLTYRGYALQYLWPDAPTWNQIALVGFSGLIYASMAVFAWSLLDLPRRSPWAFRGQALLAAVAVGHAGWIVLDPTAATFATLDLVGLGMFAALIAGALHVAWQGERLAWLYLAALGSLFAGAGVYYLTKLEVITPGPLSLQALNLGSVGEFLLLALALAYRINRLKRERDDAQQALIAALRESEQRLEQQVSARTRELAEANAQLTALAERDALTGLYNRRRFDAQLAEELARAQRSGRPLGLLMLDIDHFKDVNDLTGHTQGDVTLARLGRLIEGALLRRTDHAYRVGGEEFVVLAPDSSEDGLRQLGERLRAAVQAQHWPHPVQLCVTVSVGLTLSAPDDTPTRIYQRADAALYEAKRSGRNRCTWVPPPH